MENTAKQVLHMQPRKGFTTAQSNEHQRRWTEAGWENAIAHGNYDRSRERLNFEITKGCVVSPIDRSRSMPERMAENLRERGIKDPNEGRKEPEFRTIADFILSGSRDQMRKLAFGDQKVNYDAGFNEDNLNLKRMPEIEEWAKDMYRFMSDRYGEENIIGFYVHLDEISPHIHCTIMPIENGKFAFKKIFAGRNKYEFSRRMHELHDALAKVNAHWNLGRGSLVADDDKHITKEEYRRRVYEWVVLTEENLKEQQRILSRLRQDTKIAERRVKGLRTMIDNLVAERKAIEAEIATLKEKLANDREDHSENMRHISGLKARLIEIGDKVADKEEKLRIADQTLAELRDEQASMESLTEEMREKTREVIKGAQGAAFTRISDTLLSEMLRGFRRLLPTLDTSQREMFDVPLVEAFAGNGLAMMKCAVMLFLGYADQATQIAESNGGGGGGSSSDLEWGRDPREDDRMWALRCMHEALRLMRPTPRTQRRR
ncbi:MAG: MobV family relaxase [Bacteroidales bacterium]|nr:MobV family relaxase [Bacteroidales bacterium]